MPEQLEQLRQLEDQAYQLQATLNVIRQHAIACFGNRRVKKIEKRLSKFIEEEKNRLMQEPLS